MSERRFRVMGGPSVPWRMVEPFEDQAQTNHDQSLERLNERGGLSPAELWCVVHGRSLRQMPNDLAADAWLREWLASDVEAQTAERIAKFLEVEDPYGARVIREGKWRE